MRRRRSEGPATDREVAVAAAVLKAGSEKAAAHQLGLSHSTVKHHLASARCKVAAANTAQLVWIVGRRLPEPEGESQLTGSDDGPRRMQGPGRKGDPPSPSP